MNPHFRWFVEEIRKLPRSGPLNIIVRCNLTIIVANAKYQDLPRFFAQHKIHVISSLPYYDARNTDRQRGNGVFERSIRALKMLNEVGYGKLGSGLTLDLVYNPVGAFLPPPQQSIEDDFKQALKNQHGVDFNSLFTITNMPIARFLEYLIASDNLENYMEKLVNAFNPAAAQGVMCRNTLSIGWDGALYDCDFNQMLDIKIAHGSTPPHLRNIDWQALATREIKIDQHCYGCTAGSGSSCGGQIAPSPLLDRL
jgi:radical SAM/Cys-rich protein